MRRFEILWHTAVINSFRVPNLILNELKLDKHPDKTLSGRIESGFDFLGYHFDHEGLSDAVIIFERLKERIARLYEQCADSVRIGQYVRDG